ncbi:ABC transporter substrate-binding protein [Isoptericola variabilis]|uniref:Extracellular solute-binding protein family 1 n=1 Tax=Isoptericola variabilis (strain 225) TaxID=743718 RepID=F6FUP5_ISOV2|nr:extracellular solute-binding protein [Isoptericola variabilis]AEG43306.1 extracellular solute-binding protein family 1 [Isoptericola variabilis 225]TWH35241.1 multiple sugar transport system substrate-binding protein [Isoptericola variabilis J7]
MRVTTTRRTPRTTRAALVALTAAGAMALTACSGDSGAMPESDGGNGDAAEGGNVEIRFAWWGSDTRHETTQQIIDLFEEKNPGITVVPDYTDWGGYWDKLATSVAGGDTPDVITQEERYISDYATRGVIADLNELDIDTAEIPEEILATGEIDGKLYGIATGVNAYAMVANPEIFEQAGVEMPDDTTWTWEDYVEIAGQISEGAGDGVWGTQDYGFNEAGLNVLARQKGESLYSPDGGLGVSEETVAEFFQRSLDLMANNGQPDASRSVEIQNAGPEGSLLGTSTGAMGVWWSNQLGALSSASGAELELLRLPGEAQYERTGMYFKPAMYYSISATTEHPEEAAKFVDFLLNDPEVAALQLTDRGLPSNLSVRESIVGDLEAADQKVAEFMSDLEDEIVDSPPVPPNGSAQMQDIMTRINTEVLFGNITPQEAAERFISEVEAAIGG